MSEIVTNPGERQTRSPRSGKIGGVWRAVGNFYRIRTIPGVDVHSGSNTISFNDLFREFVVDWRILLTGTIAGFVTALLLVSGAAPTYEASLRVAPADSSMVDSSGAAGGTASVLSLFVKGGGGQYDDFAQFLDTTHSVRLAARLNAKYDLMKKIFPFDTKTGAFVPPSGTIPGLARAVRGMLGLQPWAPPNMVSLASYLRGAIDIKNEADGTATLVYYGATAEAASSFLASVYYETGELMRQEKITSHRQRSDYLSQRLSDISSLEQRTFLIGLWGREQAQMLLLTGGDPVGARMTDDIHVPNMPQNGVALKLLAGLVSGILAGLFVVIGRSAYRRA